MRRKSLVAMMLVLSLAFVCLISVPVSSAEDPWDVDTGHGNNGDMGNTGDGDDAADTSVVIIDDPEGRFGSAGGDDSGFFDGSLWRAGFNWMWDFYTMFGEHEADQSAETPAAR